MAGDASSGAMRSSPRIQWVFFDLGGTLIDFVDPVRWSECARAAGLDLEPEHLAHTYEEVEREADAAPIQPPYREFWRTVLSRSAGALVPEATLDRFAEEELRRPAQPRLFSDAVRCLTELRDDRRRMAIISNSRSAESLRWHLRDTGIEAYFAWIISSGTEGVEKPDARIFRIALDRAATTASRSVHVGDQPGRDARAAARAGLHGVWLHRGGTGFGDDPPEITSLTELPAYVRELDGGRSG